MSNESSFWAYNKTGLLWPSPTLFFTFEQKKSISFHGGKAKALFGGKCYDPRRTNEPYYQLFGYLSEKGREGNRGEVKKDRTEMLEKV